jgi:hypothetical protein
LKKLHVVLLIIAAFLLAAALPSSAASKVGTSAYIGGGRSGTVVHINGLIHSSHNAVGRLVYLQRNIQGSWQNVVGRYTNRDGRLDVYFVQPYDLTYRLKVPATSTAQSAVSGTVSVGGQPVTVAPTPAPAPSPRPAPSPIGGGTNQTAFVTGYGWPDNSPPGNVTSGPSGRAGGTGTYADPITLAVGYVGSTPDIPYGTRLYIPNVHRYFVVGDTCAACHAKPLWVDMWVGGNGSNNAGVLSCEDAVTGNYTIVKNPDANRPVVTGPIFNGACTQQFGNN